MTNLKKVLCLVLAMAMMLSVMIVGAGAAKTFPDQKDIVNTEAVNMAVALNIIKGRDTGNFDPTGNVNRAEMAKMICILLNGGKELVMDGKATPTFTDISGHWAEGYIEYCAALGIVAGRGDGTFDPWGNVTATEAAKMLMVAMGYDAAAEGFNGLNWSTQIDAVANEKGLYKDLPASLATSAALSRDNAAQMVWNALQGYMVTYKNELGMVNGQLQTVKTRETKTVTDSDSKSFSVTLLYEKYDKAVQEEATLDSFSYDSSKEEWTYNVTFRSKDNKPTTSFTSELDFTYLYKQNVKLVFNYKNNNNTKIDTFYGMFADDSVVLADGIRGDLDTVSGDLKKVKLDGTEYKLEKNIDDIEVIAFNDGSSTKLDTYIDKQYEQPADAIKLVDVDGNNKVDLIIYVPTTVAKVTYVSSKQVTAGNTTYKFEDASIYDGVAKDDFAVIVTDKYTAKEEDTLAKAESVTGTVDGTKGGDVDKGEQQVRVDGKWYTLSGDADLPDVGDTVKLAVVGDFAFDVDTTVGSSKDILFISANDFADNDLNTDYTVDARAYFPDGTNSKITIDKINLEGDGQSAEDITNKNGANWVDTDDLADCMFTYSKDKDGNYELKALGDKNLAGTDDYIDPDDSTGYNASTDTIGGKKIADDAVIFVRSTTDNKIKVKTGKNVKDWKESTSADLKGALVDEVNSMNYVTYAALVVTGTMPSAEGDRLFGYLTTDSYKGKLDGDSVTVYEIWNGSDDVKVYEDSDHAGDFKKGTAISYREDGDYITDVLTLSAAAITGFDGKVEGDIDLYSGDSDVNGSHSLDKDCVFIAMDDDKEVGEEGGIGGVPTSARKEGGTYVYNAYIAMDDDDVIAIVYDVNNELKEAKAAIAADKAITAAADDLEDAIKDVNGYTGSGTEGSPWKIAVTVDKLEAKKEYTVISGLDRSIQKAVSMEITNLTDNSSVKGKYISGTGIVLIDGSTAVTSGSEIALKITFKTDDTENSQVVYVTVTLNEKAASET